MYFLPSVDARLLQTAAEAPHVRSTDVLVLEEELDEVGRHFVSVDLYRAS